MKKQIIFSLSCLFIWPTWVTAESNLIDIPQAELSSTPAQFQEPAASIQQGSPELANEEALEFRKIDNSDGIEVYEPAQSVSPQEVTTDEVEAQPSYDLEVIELENYNEEVIEVEAPGSNEVQVATRTKAGHSYCQQNPLVKQCLYSKYLSLCKKDPQSADCQSQLEKFEGFCKAFPRAYKCKKAQLAATCTQKPQLDKCKPFTQRYCQKYPKAVFCDWN